MAEDSIPAEFHEKYPQSALIERFDRFGMLRQGVLVALVDP